MRSKSLPVIESNVANIPKRSQIDQIYQWFDSLSLKHKLLTGYGFAFTIIAAGNLTAYGIGQSMQQHSVNIQAEAIEDIESASRLQNSLLKFLLDETAILELEESTTITPVNQAKYQLLLNELTQSHIAFKHEWQIFTESDELIADEEQEGVTSTEAILGKAIIDNHKVATDQHLQQVETVLQTADASILNQAQLQHIYTQLATLRKKGSIPELSSLANKIKALVAATEEEQMEAEALFQKATMAQFHIMIGGIVISGLLGTFIVLAYIRRLLRPLTMVTETAQQSIQTANFDLHIPVVSLDEVGTLTQTFNAYMRFVKQLLEQSSQKSQQLQVMMEELQQTQLQMLQSEKMSSLGQLVAGVAHEINNPISFIYCNLPFIKEYTQELIKVIDAYQVSHSRLISDIPAEIKGIDLEFIRKDLLNILVSMEVGSDRIREIITSLRTFSRLDEAEIKAINIHDGLDGTLMILQHRLKACPEYSAIEVIKDYGTLPLVECYGGLLNQVFMNILANAIDAVQDEATRSDYQDGSSFSGVLTLRTDVTPDSQWVKIAIANNGSGIPPETQKKMFDPFFTTKPIGKGTGMGLAISHQIISERHQGKLECFSSSKTGTEFVIHIPVHHPDAK